MIFIPSCYQFCFPTLPEGLQDVYYDVMNRGWFISSETPPAQYFGMRLWKPYMDTPGHPVTPKDAGQELKKFMKGYAVAAKTNLSYLLQFNPKLTQHDLDDIDENNIDMSWEVCVLGHALDGCDIYKAERKLCIDHSVQFDQIPADTITVHRAGHQRMVLKRKTEEREHYRTYSIQDWVVWCKDNRGRIYGMRSNSDLPAFLGGGWRGYSVCGIEISYAYTEQVPGIREPVIKSIFIRSDIDKDGLLVRPEAQEVTMIEQVGWSSCINTGIWYNPPRHINEEIHYIKTYYDAKKLVEHLFESGQL